MRYAIFTDIHANLEALETVLGKIDEISAESPIDQLWFLGDLVGYGPNPNECIAILRARTEVIIAGNHDWAAVGKLDLEDFSAAARISAEWTAKELTPENREFLRNLPERLEIGECTLVHGSPYGPLWEYLTNEVLAERSFSYFNSRFCLVGHTHVPVVFQQPMAVGSEPDSKPDPAIEDTAEMSPVVISSHLAEQSETALAEAELEASTQAALAEAIRAAEAASETHLNGKEPEEDEEESDSPEELVSEIEDEGTTSETDIKHAEDRLNDEIEELLELLGLSQSMVPVTNEMSAPPEGSWSPLEKYRAIINPGGVGQPRDGDNRAAFMVYDSEVNTFEFFRLEYNYEKTQEKILAAGLPQYLAVRLAYGR